MAVSIGKTLTKVFGSRNERLLKRYKKIVQQVNALEPKVQAMTDAQLRTRTAELRQGLTSGKLKSHDMMPEAFAIIRESMDRHIGIREIFNPEQNFDPDKLDDDMLQAYDLVQQKMIQSGESWQQVAIPLELYNAVRKLYPESRPPFRARCFDVQLIGGMVLYEGRIAEMATGEGKTFVAPLACYVRALEGSHCHVVTVNDYLVRRDAMWVKPAFENLGLTVGYIQSTMDPGGDTRRQAYKSDITYGINSEFGFDFLRDNMKERVDLQVQGPLDFAIVDEVDSILIDEARTPLIISGAAHDDAEKYRKADEVARKVMEVSKPWRDADKAADTAKRAIKAAQGDIDKNKGDKEAIAAAKQRMAEGEKALAEAEARKEGLTQYYEEELDKKTVHLTHEGIAAAQQFAGVGSFYVGNNMEWPHLMEQAMRAHVVYERDKDYVVERGGKSGQMEVIIVDEFTGRKMEGRQWSDGLHQAVEAKERVPIKEETQTLATVTLQNFFKLYKGLSGMTGTAQTEAEEFSKIYKLEVVSIPTNRPMVRQDREDLVFRTEREKWTAIVDEIKEASDAGRPVLIGTTSVEKSEMLSNMLTRKYGIEHEVLNAKQHEREAHIVENAGKQHADGHGTTVGNVTIATNMAGRGTDIKIVPDGLKAGGLHVIGTERHTARRIDNQLRGRSGRQGDAGSSQFYISLQDDLMKMFAGEWTIKVLGWLGMKEGEAIQDKRITKGIIRAQKKVEERNFLSRKNLLEYDEVNDHHRSIFYGIRQKVLEGRDISEIIWQMIGESVADAVDRFITQDFIAASIAEWAKTNCNLNLEAGDFHGMRHYEELVEFLHVQAEAEADTRILTDLQELTGEEAEDASAWDTKAISSWAMSRLGINLPQSQIRKLNLQQLKDWVKEAAIEQIDRRDYSGIQKYLQPLYAEKELAAWAKDKFQIEFDPKDFLEDSRSNEPRPASEIVEMIEQGARKSYAKRELEYPADSILGFAFGGEDGSAANPYAADFVRGWVKAKYGRDWTIEQIQKQSVRQMREEFLAMQRAFLLDGELEKEVDRILTEGNGDEAKTLQLFQNRFPAPPRPQVKGRVDESAALPLRDRLLQRGRAFLRQELTDLEAFVLIQILDQSWKDHLYALDMLKSSIGLQAFAEQDPRVIYKTEGFECFKQMMIGVRDKVTDLIFRARVVGQAETRNAYNVTGAVHEEAAGYGVGENVAATADVRQGSPSELRHEADAGASAGDGGPAVVQTIVRQNPKVGRNDPCPCGSGKKYKKCHGAGVAA